jgi:glycolate oxidase
VLRVRVATIGGDIIELGSEAPDAPGLDLLAVFIGSEGMLGIVTEVTVKLVPSRRCSASSWPPLATSSRAGMRWPR